MLPRASVRQILSHATVFACPSVYEPLGIVNLEAMACETAVVASAVGGIPEVVVDGETGYLVPYDPARAGDAEFVAGFEAEFAARVNALTADPAKATAFGLAGRQRCVDEFSWAKIAAADRRRLPRGHRVPRESLIPRRSLEPRRRARNGSAPSTERRPLRGPSTGSGSVREPSGNGTGPALVRGACVGIRSGPDLSR